MAGNNHKPDLSPHSNDIKPERRLKVSSIVFDRKNPIPGAFPRIVSTSIPWIRMQGKWLEQAGFTVHAVIRVRVMKGCLVLTTD